MRALTAKQLYILEALRSRIRYRLRAFRESNPLLFQENCRRLTHGEEVSAFWVGELTCDITRCTGFDGPYVLRTLHALARRGLVLRETFQDRRWWPIGLADEICRELVGGVK